MKTISCGRFLHQVSPLKESQTGKLFLITICNNSSSCHNSLLNYHPVVTYACKWYGFFPSFSKWLICSSHFCCSYFIKSFLIPLSGSSCRDHSKVCHLDNSQHLICSLRLVFCVHHLLLLKMVGNRNVLKLHGREACSGIHGLFCFNFFCWESKPNAEPRK